MNPAPIVENIELLISAAFLIWFFYGPWQSLVVDVLRQNLFRMRDDLFSEAADGKWSFDSNEYQVMRGRFNAMIRYAHTVRPSYVLAALCVKQKEVTQFNIVQFVATIKDRKLAAKVFEYHNNAILLIVLSMAVRSVILLVVNTVLAPFVFVLLFADARAKERLASLENAIERDVEVELARVPA
jgi:hypothetical protein